MRLFRLKLPIKISLQTKLILSLLTVVTISGLGALLVGKAVIDKNIIHQAYEEVGKKLEMVEDVYANRLYVKHRLITSLAAYPAFQSTVRDGNRSQIHASLQGLKEPSFDILNVTDAEGRILVRSRDFRALGDSVADDPYVRAVIQQHKAVWGFDVMSREALHKESHELAVRALVPLRLPFHSPGDDETVEKRAETRGMMLKVASPIMQDGKLIGVIYGASLLNNDESILEKARSLVLGDEQIDGRHVASATLFLDGVRIATTLRDLAGELALGTPLANEVFQRVFVDGQRWHNRTEALGMGIIAGYKPIRNIEGKTIGILYAGMLEEKFTRINDRANQSFLIMMVITGVFSLLLAAYLVHHFIRPISAMVFAAQEIAAGNYRKVEIRTNDEMGYLGEVFNEMVEALAEKDRRFMENVEKRIERTEKLAVLGRLASGIAHEINNPLTGVLAFTDILLETLSGTEHEADLKVIKSETLRCREIVRGMLDFARETQLEMVRTNLNKIINAVLQVLRNHVSFQNIGIERKLDPDLPDIYVDINQIKSVINNLAVNAADAMPNGGSLTITTSTTPDRKYVHLRITDTGVGISEENLLKVFDPFFTTKEIGKGTGLGLSVTYGIIKRHNGLINIKSQVGVGTRIDVHLPVNPEEKAHD